MEFLTEPPDASLLYVGSYTPAWVITSVFLAVLGSYGALRASARVGHLRPTTSKLAWVSISAMTMGLGVWAMHFIGMLALSLPCRVNYDPLITLASMIPGILAGCVAFGVGWHGTKHISPPVSSVLLGAGISTMHYTGMAAARLEGFVRYDPLLFALSIFVAIGLSYVALRFKDGKTRLMKGHDALVAVVMGGAVSGMHYTAMSSAYFVRGDVAALPSSFFTTRTLAIAVATTTAFLALGALALAAISRNREMMDQLRDSERRNRQLLTENETVLSTVMVGIAHIKKRRIVSCNRRLEEIFQYEPGELIGKSTERLYDLHKTFRYVGDTVYGIGGEVSEHPVEVRMQRKDGSLFWGTVTGRAVDPSRPDDGSIWSCSDITERKQAEEQIHIAATAFESQEGMMVTDSNSVILRVNRAFTEMTGYTAEEVVGQTPHLLSSGRHDADFYREMWDAILRTGGWQGEIWDRRKNGEVYPKWLTISTVKDDVGATTHFVGTHYDMTERKNSEIAMLNLNRDLRESRQRLRELAAQNEARLEGERKHIAQEVHDELGQVLTALRMDLSLLGMQFGSLDPAVNDKVLDMKVLVDRAIHGVRNVAVNLRPTALDMGLVSAIEWLCKEFTRQTTVACVFLGQEEKIDLDEARAVVIFRIVQESLTNVTRYAQASQVEITLGLRGHELGLEVRDNGLGFDLAAAAKRKSFGLLGMRERALALGGHVDIISAPGQGTVIGVSIPLDPDTAKENP
jgi:PAS domain S-box-containing protein